MIQNEREIRHEHVLQAVRQMMTAARTAPKGKGIDIIEVAMVTDEDIKHLSEELVIMSGETGLKFFLRCIEFCIAFSRNFSPVSPDFSPKSAKIPI